ncbi:MAG: isoleucine--tRNA ligase [Halobacteriota archaeon]|nr:isoleucine--tRNA ligase [Halobacteriota archaeon]
MIKEISAQYDGRSIKTEIEKFWNDEDVYSKVRRNNREGEKFLFVDGPPYTTGKVHLGTAWNKIIKDCVLRYLSMNGFDLQDRAGWDMHGLPIEVKVEEMLGFSSKKDIEEHGVDNFIEECKRFAIKNKEEMTVQFKMLGAWLDWENPYMTVKPEYIEATWWTLKRAHERNLLEKGTRVISWCPRCETAIAESEIEYRDVTDPSICVKFPIKGEEDTYIVIWTTTPWTLPSNIAVAVHPSFEYTKVRAYKDDCEETLILASDLIEPVLRMGRYKDYDILERLSGTDIEGLEYTHPLEGEVPRQKEFSHNVYLADFVTMENTGCVHIAPGHGPDDFALGKAHGLPIFCPVDSRGIFKEDAGKYANKNVKMANKEILEDLKANGILLSTESISHRYGHCWRCDTAIIYLTTEQWFLRVTDIKDEMLAEIDRVSWYPDWAGKSRFYDWILGIRDWCISRQRYWGIPLPIWTCKCGNIEVIGTIEELKEKAIDYDDTDLHIPYIDGVHLKCSCKEEMTRVKDIFDVWFDSAVASWAGLYFPQQKDLFDEWWPADWITEGHDQTRGWFYSQLGASMVAFGRAPYKSVLMHGFTLDAGGNKMSKRLGNVIEPEEVVNKYGTDTLRLYLLSTSAPWDDLKFNWEEVKNVNRALNILWNVYRFPLPYMVLDSFDPTSVELEDVKKDLRQEDRWVLSRLQSLIVEISEKLKVYELHKASRLLLDFVLEDLSRWYVQLIRPRTWTEKDDPDKIAAYYTVYEVLMTLTKVLAPFAPFLSEEIYQNLVRGTFPSAPISVHMSNWPEVNEELRDQELEEMMAVAREFVEATSNARQSAKRKLRWPVKRIVISPGNDLAFKTVDQLKQILKGQTNAKEIVLLGVDEEWDELGLEVIPNPKVIGPKFKGRSGEIIKALKEADGKLVKGAISEGYEVLGEVISEDMVDFRESVPEFIAFTESQNGRVYVDVELTEEIESEGYARETIRRLQEMRKEMDLNVEDYISASVSVKDERIARLMGDWEPFISEEIRAKDLKIGNDVTVQSEYVKDWVVEGVEMKLGISR